MRVAVVFFASDSHHQKMLNLSKALAKGIANQDSSFQVTLVDAFRQPEVKLSSFKYIAMGVETISLFRGSISNNVSLFLAQCGHLVGKIGYAFAEGKWLGAQKTVLKLMGLMEAQGMKLRLSDIVFHTPEAESIGETLKID